MKFVDKFSLVLKSEQERLKKKLSKEISGIKSKLDKVYETEYASLNLPEDKQIVRSCLDLANKYKKKKVLVIGIGGSNLGTKAIAEAVLGANQNEIYFADTVDTQLIKDLKNLRNVVVNVVSKSGTTTETISNFFALNLKAPVVVTTDKGSKLWEYAETKSYDKLEIPKRVGGRFSVFSAVGLFPLAVAGVNVRKLLKGASEMRLKCLNTSGISAKSAIQLYSHYKKGRNIAETFVFCPEWESIGKWYRQLIGESIGKQYNVNKKTVWNGMTPTVAVGSTDLHSMAQLYLGGPKDKFVSFLVPEYKTSIKVPRNNLVSMAGGKSLAEIMNAIIKGIQEAFKKQKRPFNEITMKVRNEEELGSFLQMKMIEIIFLASLMNVNPFDQPNVEEYKVLTRKILEK